MTTALACAFAAAVLTVVMVVYEVGSSPVVLQLERALPRLNHTLDVAALLAHDLQRSSRLQQSPVPGGVVDFPLHGSIEIGNYYTKVKLGTPPTEFKLLVDTGSTISWVRCSGIGHKDIYISHFNRVRGASCALPHLGHSHVQTGVASPRTSRCGTRLSKLFEMDGILAFGPGLWSIITQLSEEGVTPSAFSHCLDGGLEGGGTLVLGEALEPGMITLGLAGSYVLHLGKQK
ncbi:hypothetical protein CRG98_042281 [Punica granatum]|uniref:Peptidase A1 domain-containing protein n=1 Tax=Punica granatum TaxID=22663 RepID=A0A2I0I036_PUNGR|nr:hypothetical protein CRG98_042281 [Punica granatum]